VIRGELAFASDRDGRAASELSDRAEKAAANGQRTRFAQPDSAWATEPAPRGERARASTFPNQVELKRVPRDKVAAVLPELVAGRGPLRVVMDRR
jgi:hypothetical protein